MSDNYRKPDYIIDLSRKLRKGQTESERLLWIRLRNKQIDDLNF